MNVWKALEQFLCEYRESTRADSVWIMESTRAKVRSVLLKLMVVYNNKCRENEVIIYNKGLILCGKRSLLYFRGCNSYTQYEN